MTGDPAPGFWASIMIYAFLAGLMLVRYMPANDPLAAPDRRPRIWLTTLHIAALIASAAAALFFYGGLDR